jgi:hypothetical protein
LELGRRVVPESHFLKGLPLLLVAMVKSQAQYNWQIHSSILFAVVQVGQDLLKVLLLEGCLVLRLLLLVLAYLYAGGSHTVRKKKHLPARLPHN